MSVKSQTSDFFLKNWFVIFSLIVSGVTAYNTIKDHEKRISKIEDLHEKQEAIATAELKEALQRAKERRHGRAR